MLNFIICEDNQEYLNRIGTLLTKIMMPYNFEYRIHKFMKYEQKFRNLINDNTTQKVYILDVELPEVSGLEIASEIRENDWNSIIIFVTAHTECKDDIFYSRLLAIDYIAKNKLSYDRLEETIKVVLDKFSNERVYAFNYNSVTYRIPYKNILYIEKVPRDKRVNIVTESGEVYEDANTITNLNEKLGKNFYLTHKSCLVNLKQIKHIDYSQGIITFKNGVKTDLLSKRHKKDLKNYVSNL